MNCQHHFTADYPIGGKYCHACGKTLTKTSMTKGQELYTKPASSHMTKGHSKRPDPAKANTFPYSGYWAGTLRYMLLSCLLVVTILFSLKERQLETGWWITVLTMVNIPAFLCALLLCTSTNKYGNDPEKGLWRVYHDWLHIPTAALTIVLGYQIVCNIQNLLTFLLMGLLMLVLLWTDFKD